MKTYFSGGNLEGLMLHGMLEVGYEDGHYFVDMSAKLRKNGLTDVFVLLQTVTVGFVIDGVVHVRDVELQEKGISSTTGKIPVATAKFLVPVDQFEGRVELRLGDMLVSDYIPKGTDGNMPAPNRLEPMVAITKLSKKQLTSMRDEAR